MKTVLLSLSLLIGVISSGCIATQPSPEKLARLGALESKAKSGTTLSFGEWRELIRPPDNWNNRTFEWAVNLIGRPDETISDGRELGGTFLIWNGKVMNNLTGKPDDLCFKLSFGLLEDGIFDAAKVRNLGGRR